MISEHPLPANTLRPMSMTDVARLHSLTGDWLWQGGLIRGQLTLLTSRWKLGKTTLMAGLLARLADGGDFLGFPLPRGRALVISEESLALWRTRLATQPIGEAIELLSRPFRSLPSAADWAALLAGPYHPRPDLVVVDTLASFMPGVESNPATLADFIQPLQELAADGAAVLVLHHPRKGADDTAPRGSRALRQAFDLHLGLTLYSPSPADETRRRLTGHARDTAWTLRLAYDWHRPTGTFTPCDLPADRLFLRHWQHVEEVLTTLARPATVQEILSAWPATVKAPSESTLYDWLNRAYTDKRVQRSGKGNSSGAYRYSVSDS